MWEEKQAKEGETVKITFAEWTERNPRIGVVDRFSNGKIVIDIGDRMLWLDCYTSFMVWNPAQVMQSIH